MTRPSTFSFMAPREAGNAGASASGGLTYINKMRAIAPTLACEQEKQQPSGAAPPFDAASIRGMPNHFDTPFVVFALALAAQGVATYVGDLLRRRARNLGAGERHYFDTVQAATLTLLALIIGFTFSMAVTRYDLRKTLEEAEANAIGTEYLRSDLLPGDVGARTRALLRNYIDLRIAFYNEGDERHAAEISQQTAKLQNELWAALSPTATNQPTPTIALVTAGMNDVLNSQGYTQAAWWNRIPIGAWAMMGLMAISCNLLVGYSERRKGELFLFILPVVVSISFFLIADLDSPRGGVIHVQPQNLTAAAQAIKQP